MIRVGIIGLGVGEAHLKSYQSIKDVEVSAICDLDKEKVKKIAKKYHIKDIFTDSKNITEHKDIDLVSICSYDNYHAEQIISSFENNKHVMVEKPVTLFKKESEKVIRAWQDSKCQISSNLILRQSPRFIMLKNMIEKGNFGLIYHIEGDYLHNILWKITDGWRGKMPFYCTVYGGGIHLIDLMRWLINDEVIEVNAMSNNILTSKSSYKYPETISALLKFKNGATGKNTTTYGPKRTKFHSLNIYGTKKTYVNNTGNGEIFSGCEPESMSLDKSAYPGMQKGDLIPQFIHAIQNNTFPIVKGQDIFRVMDICFAIWESVKLKKNINVSYII